mmetsp:Transcript_18953/g.48860  ORF Transcript_18953/g.48860 Transcript_18953/m.48860 type:complete len:250 (-) Transcript_18953:680-1429(-)
MLELSTKLRAHARLEEVSGASRAQMVLLSLAFEPKSKAAWPHGAGRGPRRRGIRESVKRGVLLNRTDPIIAVPVTARLVRGVSSMPPRNSRLPVLEVAQHIGRVAARRGVERDSGDEVHPRRPARHVAGFAPPVEGGRLLVPPRVVHLRSESWRAKCPPVLCRGAGGALSTAALVLEAQLLRAEHSEIHLVRLEECRAARLVRHGARGCMARSGMELRRAVCGSRRRARRAPDTTRALLRGEKLCSRGR